MSKHSYPREAPALDKLTSKDFTGSGKKKFIKQGKAQFADLAKESAGRKVAEGRRGGSKSQSDGGVSHETGYRNRPAPGYHETPAGL